MLADKFLIVLLAAAFFPFASCGAKPIYPCANLNTTLFPNEDSDVYSFSGVSPVLGQLAGFDILRHEPALDFIIPAAELLPNGRSLINYSTGLPEFVCPFIVANLLSMDKRFQIEPSEVTDVIWMPAQNEMHDCANDSSKTNTECLIAYSQTLDRTISTYLEDYQEDQVRDLIVSASVETREAVAGLIMHEVGHHVRSHFSRLRDGKIERRQAEAEADFYAIETLIANGVHVSGYASFFLGLGLAEISSGLRSDIFYETPICRFANTHYVGRDKGVLGAFFISWAIFGTRSHTPASIEDAILVKRDSQEVSQESVLPENCWSHSDDYLQSAEDELLTIGKFLLSRRKVLFSHSSLGKEMPSILSGSKSAIIELNGLIANGRALNALKARLMMIFLRRHLRSGNEDRFSKPEILEILTKVVEFGVEEDVLTATVFLKGIE